LVGNKIPERMGSEHPNIVPYGKIFYTRDGKPLVLAVGSDKQFAELCSILGKPELAADERFATNFNRVKNRAACNEAVQSLIAQFDRDPLLAELEKRSVPAGGVYNMKEVFEIPEVQELVMDGKTTSGMPIKGLRTVAFSMGENAKPMKLQAPPHYGEHTVSVLKEILGYSAEDINGLIEKKVVYARK